MHLMVRTNRRLWIHLATLIIRWSWVHDVYVCESHKFSLLSEGYDITFVYNMINSSDPPSQNTFVEESCSKIAMAVVQQLVDEPIEVTDFTTVRTPQKWYTVNVLMGSCSPRLIRNIDQSTITVDIKENFIVFLHNWEREDWVLQMSTVKCSDKGEFFNDKSKLEC